RRFYKALPGKEPVAVRMERGYPILIVATERTSGAGGTTFKPAPQATVTLLASPDDFNVYDEPVGPDGQLTLRVGRARDLRIYVRHPELLWPRWERIEEWGNFGDFPFDHTIDAILRRRAKVTGRVVDEKTRQPLSGVQLGLIPAGFNGFIAYGRSDEK